MSGKLLCNVRPAYYDKEISQLIKEKMKKENLNKEDLYNLYKKKYKISLDLINFMLKENVSYNLEMLKIASDYLDIDFNNLTELLEDDSNLSLRSEQNTKDEDINNFFIMVDILFSEMIKQKRLDS